MGTSPESTSGDGGRRGGAAAAGGALALKAAVLLGGALLLKTLRKSTTRWEHARAVADILSGEKDSSEQARRDPDSYTNIRMTTCPVAEMADGARILYFEESLWRARQKPFRQRFYVVKPCQKEMKCDVELTSYAIRDSEEYKNLCERPRDQRPQPEEIIEDIAKNLATIHLSQCERGKRCVYEGSTPPGGFPNSWKGSTFCTSELTIFKNGEIHTLDKGYDDGGNQVWGPTAGPYEFKPSTPLTKDEKFSPMNFLTSLFLGKKSDIS